MIILTESTKHFVLSGTQQQASRRYKSVVLLIIFSTLVSSAVRF